MPAQPSHGDILYVYYHHGCITCTRRLRLHGAGGKGGDGRDRRGTWKSPFERPIAHFGIGLRVTYCVQYSGHRFGLVAASNVIFTTSSNDFINDYHVSFRRRGPGNPRLQ